MKCSNRRLQSTIPFGTHHTPFILSPFVTHWNQHSFLDCRSFSIEFHLKNYWIHSKLLWNWNSSSVIWENSKQIYWCVCLPTIAATIYTELDKNTTTLVLWRERWLRWQNVSYLYLSITLSLCRRVCARVWVFVKKWICMLYSSSSPFFTSLFSSVLLLELVDIISSSLSYIRFQCFQRDASFWSVLFFSPSVTFSMRYVHHFPIFFLHVPFC